MCCDPKDRAVAALGAAACVFLIVVMATEGLARRALGQARWQRWQASWPPSQRCGLEAPAAEGAVAVGAGGAGLGG